jgi:hypothetical protein
MEAGKLSFKFSRQTQKKVVGSSKYAYFNNNNNNNKNNKVKSKPLELFELAGNKALHPVFKHTLFIM